jgi:hypothetical protein
VQVEAVEDRPRPTAWSDGVGKGPIINDGSQKAYATQGMHLYVEKKVSYVVWRHKMWQLD